MSKDNTGSVMVAFVMGALTGAAVALLFAPASGEETREYLGQRAREGKDKAREALERACSTGRLPNSVTRWCASREGTIMPQKRSPDGKLSEARGVAQ